MWHHPATSELEAGIILLSGATTRECSNATLFQFRTSRWFKPAWSRSIWSIDAIGFCFARVMWRSMASVLDLYSFNPFWYAVHLRALDQKKWFSLCDAVPNFFAGPIQALHPWFRNLVCGSLPRCCTVQLVTAPCRRLGRAVQKSICGCVFNLSHIQESFVSKTDCEVDETVATCCWLGHIGAKSLILILFEPMNVPHSVHPWNFAYDTFAGKTKGSL